MRLYPTQLLVVQPQKHVHDFKHATAPVDRAVPVPIATKIAGNNVNQRVPQEHMLFSPTPLTYDQWMVAKGVTPVKITTRE